MRSILATSLTSLNYGSSRTSWALPLPCQSTDVIQMIPMRSRSIISIVLLVSCHSLAMSEELIEAKAMDTRTFVRSSLTVPAFSPPAPAVEKKVPAMRIDSAVTLPTKGNRTLTILRAEASTLPDIPIPPKPVPHEARPLTPEELARQAEERRRRLNFSAVVHENGVSVIRWQHPDTKEAYEAICGFDVNLLAGIGIFTSEGKIYQLSFIPPGVLPANRERFGKLPFPKPPEAAPGTVTITRGNAQDPIGTATATLLRDLITSEKSRLTIYQEQRRTYQQAAAEWEKDHPVLPRDETVWLRPHRGSRYLTNPTPEKGIAR